jgi:hypothetical protein
MTRADLLRACALAALLLLHPDRGAACPFHTTLPDASVTEQIAESVEVIAARPSAGEPFRFATVAQLRGAPSGSTPPHLADSATRTRLAAHPDEAVLFALAPDGTWTRLLTVDAATRPLVTRMVARAEVWTTPEGAAERRDAFAALLADPDPRLRRLGLRELDALPYEVLRRGSYPVPAVDLLEGITDMQEMPYAPIRILLLGLSGSPGTKDAIMDRLGELTAAGTHVNLGAWLTAAIEDGGPVGVARAERVLLDAPRSLTEMQLIGIIRAFSVQSAEGDAALRTALDTTLRRLASRYPEAAPLIAQAFGAAGDYSQEALIRELLTARAFTDRRDLMAATAYVTRASGVGSGSSIASRPGIAVRNQPGPEL